MPAPPDPPRSPEADTERKSAPTDSPALESSAREWLTVARISKTRGLRGEVVARLFTDFPRELAERTEVFLWDGNSEPRRVQVEKTWFQKDALIFKFSGIDSIEAGEQLRDLEVQLPSAEAVPLPAGAHYRHELEGCRVVEAGTGKPLGTVREVEGTPGNLRLAVDATDGKELLIPFAQEFCTRIAPQEKLIEVALPDGLLDLNR